MANASKPVVLLGDANADLIVRLPQTSGNRAPVAPPELRLGGTVANTLRALCALSVPAVFLGACGDDAYGRFVRRSLAESGADVSRLVTAREAFTTLVLVVVAPDGERTLFGFPRRGAAHGRLPLEAADPALISGAAWLHTSGMSLVEPQTRDTMLRAMELAQQFEVPVSFDLNLRIGFRDGRFEDGFLGALDDALSFSDVVFGSAADEIAHLRDGDGDEARARALVAALPRAQGVVVSRLGAAGAMAVTAQETLHAPAYTVRAVNTVGAGDVFNAGFIAARVAGHSLPESLRWGNAVAALKISREGDAPPTRDEVEALLNG